MLFVSHILGKNSFKTPPLITFSCFSKENTVLRASLNPDNVFVVPNAIVGGDFAPPPQEFIDTKNFDDKSNKKTRQVFQFSFFSCDCSHQ